MVHPQLLKSAAIVDTDEDDNAFTKYRDKAYQYDDEDCDYNIEMFECYNIKKWNQRTSAQMLLGAPSPYQPETSEGLPQVHLNTAKRSGGILEDVPTQSTTFDRQSETVSSTAILVLINNYAVSYIQQDGTKKTVYAKDGWNLLDLAHSNNIELEGACEGSLACSTCHIVMQKEFYEKLEEPSDEENDMLDLGHLLGCSMAFTLTSKHILTHYQNKDLDSVAKLK
ncbi:hypothetical protein CcCBS67573_g07734 [Chytriomyces confervae]|uniref:2Fe-2S ferredoxin-type domain-containing protein n=1 Tax=Chytriomyces confervae TaxID=246404 RepID=A0A507ES46_9FUNG|nr:hypothetical protein CcCBS67573_g07734 [Chytriomyces confervae]